MKEPLKYRQPINAICAAITVSHSTTTDMVHADLVRIFGSNAQGQNATTTECLYLNLNEMLQENTNDHTQSTN